MTVNMGVWDLSSFAPNFRKQPTRKFGCSRPNYECSAGPPTPTIGARDSSTRGGNGDNKSTTFRVILGHSQRQLSLERDIPALHEAT